MKTSTFVAAFAALAATAVLVDAISIGGLYVPTASELQAAFQKFKLTHSKVYRTIAAEQAAFAQFTHHFLRIITLRNATSNGDYFNKFSDQDYVTFSQSNMGFQKHTGGGTGGGSVTPLEWRVPNGYTPPASVDWVAEGIVTSVKNQGSCGSCWTFAAAATLEGQLGLATGLRVPNLYSLSEQNLLDCTSSSYSCNGGNTQVALSYVFNNGGIDTFESYKYVDNQLPCQYLSACSGSQSVSQPSVVVTNSPTPSNLEDSLTAAVAKIGPIAVSIYASENLQDYTGGIFMDPSCNGQQANHAVTVVGYGTQGGVPYYLVKNSWGTDWGEGGYVLFYRGGNNMCGIASDPVFPHVNNVTVNNAACTMAGGNTRTLYGTGGDAGTHSPVVSTLIALAAAASALAVFFF